MALTLNHQEASIARRGVGQGGIPKNYVYMQK